MHSLIDDSALSQLVTVKTNTVKDHYLLVVNAFTSLLYLKAKGKQSWEFLGGGELGNKTIDALKLPLKNSRVSWLETNETDLMSIDVAQASSNIIKSAEITAWVKTASNLSEGRGAEPDSKVKHVVGCAAGWHCQFDGCGEDLCSHAQPNIKGNFSYFAHIIASSANGPRGDTIESPKRAQDPENLMLLCDKCHRLIDRVAPHKYPADLLFRMRKNNIREVSNLLNTLKYETSQMIAVVQDIQGQTASFDERSAEEAMWVSKLRQGGQQPVHFMRNGSLSTSNDDGYWYGMFKALKLDIPTLLRCIRGTDADTGKPKRIALFPLHSTSVLIATGRILGEASSITQFQFHRDQVAQTLGEQWAWSLSPEPSRDKYKIIIEKDMDGNHQEALLRVQLTAAIANDQLPTNFYANENFQIPSINITIDTPNRNAIGHPADLVLLGKVIDEAYRVLQDSWHIKTVHLIVVAPATACVRVGQKMQARNHSDFILYERNPAAENKSFQQTIAITSTNIKHGSGETIEID